MPLAHLDEEAWPGQGPVPYCLEERYGEERLPRRGNGQIFRLAECFYSPHTSAGDIVADEIIDGFDVDQHIVGTIHNVEFIDDRWRDGLPNLVITVLDPPKPPDQPDAGKIRFSMTEVLDGPSTFQAEAASIQKLLRRYLELLEQQDRETGGTPRVQLFTHHRVVPAEGDWFIHEANGRKRIRIEALKEFDFKGQFVRVREPGSELIDLGVPELFMIAQGFNSSDAKRLGFEQHDVEDDHGDGCGPVVAQADFLAGLVEVLVGGRLRRRISSTFDQNGKEYWVRQIAVGHENDPEVGWVLVQVPDFKTFDPIEAGILPAGTSPDSPEFFASYQQLIYDYYIKQAAETLEIPVQTLMKVQMIYGPTLFSLIERVGDDPLTELDTDHPLQRPDREASLLAVMKSLPGKAEQASSKPDADQKPVGGETTIVMPKLRIGQVEPENAKIYAFLDIQLDEQRVQRVAIKKDRAIIGRGDPKRGIVPDIDLTPFDQRSTTSRQHARIRQKGTGFFLEDLQSRNKTRLGELTLAPYQLEMLQDGDEVRFGLVQATFRLLGTSELPVPWSPS